MRIDEREFSDVEMQQVNQVFADNVRVLGKWFNMRD